MNSSFENLPNEIMVYEIFPYCTLIDLTYAFGTLNRRFTELLRIFLRKKIHSIHITNQVSYHHLHFIIDDILPQLDENHHFKSIQTSHGEVFVSFLHKLSRINTNHLERIFIDSYIDPTFDLIMQCIAASPQLKTCRLKILTSVDRSWANGRKWIRWFELMKKLARDQILKDLHISVWVIDRTDVIYFDRQYWNADGSYTENHHWKVQLQPDNDFYTRSIHRTVQYSRTDHDQLRNCQPS